MSTAVNFNATAYTVPAAGELNWSSLSAFLVDVGNNGQATTFQKWAQRTATTTPVTVSATTDCVIISNLTVAGAVAVNLPAAAAKQVFIVVDGKGDANTNPITIDANASQTINGALTYTINRARAGVILVSDGSNWFVVAEFSNMSAAGAEITTTDIVSVDTTIASGITAYHANLSIAAGKTYTVNGSLMTMGRPITGTGVLAGTGTIY